jgi:hypothetical protein
MDIPHKEIKKARGLITSVPKRVNYRDIHKEITENDYQFATIVDFEPVELSNDNPMETWGRLKHIFEDEITTQYESNPKSGSKYFTTKDGYVFRLSDHWGIVKSCIWTRAGKGNMDPREMISGPIEIGRAHISDFQIRDLKNHWKKEKILNPEWVDIMLGLVDFTNHLTELKFSDEFKQLPDEDKQILGTTWGMLVKNLKSIPSLEYSHNNHIFVK